MLGKGQQVGEGRSQRPRPFHSWGQVQGALEASVCMWGHVKMSEG